MLPKLQYISQGINPQSHLLHIEQVLQAGVKFIQLRLKQVPDAVYTEIGEQALKLCHQHGALLIINDNVQVAKTIHANGLHLGLEDMPVSEAKKIVPNTIIGGTANTFEQVKQRVEEEVDYIGLGPYRFTGTKEKLSPILGLEGYVRIFQLMKEQGLNTPVYAIGGIQVIDVAPLVEAGVYGIAVSGLLTASGDKKQLVKEINKLLDHV